MHAAANGTRQIVNAPPAHLQEHETDYQHAEGYFGILIAALAFGRRLVSATNWQLAVVDVDEIAEPGDGCPRLLRVPRPVVAPRLFRP